MWLLATPLVGVALLLTGCSGGSSSGAGPSPTPKETSTSSAPAVDPAAAEALSHAVTVTKALRAFSFTAKTTLEAKQTVRTRLSGRVINGRGIAYRLAVGGKRTQVIRIRHATYVRSLPGGWSRLAQPRAILHPSSTLISLLQGMTPTFVSHRHGKTRVVGMLAAGPAKATGIPVSGAPARAIVIVDRQGRVTDVLLRSTTTAGSRTVRIAVATHYADFNHVRAITRP